MIPSHWQDGRLVTKFSDSTDFGSGKDEFFEHGFGTFVYADERFSEKFVLNADNYGSMFVNGKLVIDKYWNDWGILPAGNFGTVPTEVWFEKGWNRIELSFANTSGPYKYGLNKKISDLPKIKAMSSEIYDVWR